MFDCLCVLFALPLLIPILAVVGLAVRLTSRGPVLFLQKRMGCHGRPFTILKFRTMTHCEHCSHNPVTTTENQRFTPIGPFLRRWKFDELPQLLNVLVGDMSMVGPRPKLLEHQVADLCCRPGITGAATIAFAREEQILARLPDHHLDDYYSRVILPFKHQLDAEYMARATFLSDLKLVLDSALRRWDPSVVDRLLHAEALLAEDNVHRSKSPVPMVVSIRVSTMSGDDALVSDEQFTQV
ncbi:MAG: sugar transferase [Acidobacteriota bacterium]|nr:sugar transferase [Acidobacteriota bacterium]